MSSNHDPRWLERLWRGSLALTLAGLVGAGALAATASATPSTERTGEAGGLTQTRTLSRVFAADGAEEVVDSREVTVQVSHADQLRGRERVKVSWSGARPSGARAADPYGENGLSQEYPVVVMQCRGTDDPDAPASAQVRPETCWTSTRQQRSLAVSDRTAVWRHDLFATDAAREAKSGRDPFPATECNDPASLSSHVTPFQARDGKEHLACTAETMPPEAAVGAAYPPAEVAAFTGADGTGSVSFEVRSDVENGSLGCSATVACSIVVVPIMGISCLDDDRECRRAGRWLPGSSNFSQQGVDLAVSPQLWWSESNWRNRFTFPVTFGLPADTCDIQDSRPPTGFYGSELLAQAALQWSPAYCLSKSRFKFQHNRMPDEAGFKLMETGQGAAALVSGERESTGDAPVGYAPTAITGFSVGYSIDRPDNAGEYGQLRLNARLLAKLLTQSYLGSDLGRGHPGIEDNPLSINRDPEFQRLNPGLDDTAREAAATVLSLSESSDVIESLTSYLQADPAARAFIAGKPDPWGMVINPSYKAIALPTREWPLLDEYVPSTERECLQQNPAPYFTQLAAPVATMRKIAEAVLDAWPNVQTRCERATSSDPWKLGRVERQGLGTRFVLGIVSLGDSARFGLRDAALETKPGSFVAPSEASMAAAVKLAKQKERTGPFVIEQKAVRASGKAYPGTMVVYTAARLHGADKAESKKVAQFIRVATTEGQRPGRGNGDLPAGYLPIRRAGVTAPLFATAQRVADLVEAQQAPTTAAEPGDGEDDGTTDPSTDAPGTAPDPDDAENPDQDGPTTAQDPTKLASSVTATPDSSSRLGRVALPLALGIALLGGLLSSAARVMMRLRRIR
ncbi:hypothetical protein NODU109028_16150 [Nocardioides dubius]|uniref:Uncharacterized protein n=1 Tax=Nocardioides dubius TaxID=317019 RepID=A0ABP4EN16_9ACTN